MEFVTGKHDIPYTMENKGHVWNHQPGYSICSKFSTSNQRV